MKVQNPDALFLTILGGVILTVYTLIAGGAVGAVLTGLVIGQGLRLSFSAKANAQAKKDESDLKEIWGRFGVLIPWGWAPFCIGALIAVKMGFGMAALLIFCGAAVYQVTMSFITYDRRSKRDQTPKDQPPKS